MSFLEFLLDRYIGPTRGKYWPCPFCEHPTPSLVVNEPLGRHAIKYRCHRCRAWGDEFDVLKLFHPHTRYPERCEMAAELRRVYEAEEAAEGAGVKRPDRHRHRDHFSFPRGVDHPTIAEAWSDAIDEIARLGRDPDRVFDTIAELYEAGYFRDLGRLVGYLLAYDQAFREWKAGTDEEHRFTCRRPGCDWVVCRAAHGLPPLPRPTPEERREAARRKAAEEAAEREEAGRRVEDIERQINETIESQRSRTNTKRRSTP